MLNSTTPKFFGEKEIKSALPLKLTHCALAEGWNKLMQKKNSFKPASLMVHTVQEKHRVDINGTRASLYRIRIIR